MHATNPLSALPVYSSDNADEIADRLGSFYNDSDVAISPVGGRRVSLDFFAAPLGSHTVDVMEWPFGVDCETPELIDTYDFCSMLAGSAKIVVGNEQIACDQKCGFVLSPNRPMRVYSDSSFAVFNLKISRPHLESHLSAVAGIDVPAKLEFDAAFPSNDDSRAGLWRFVRLIVDEILGAQAMFHPLVIERFSEAVQTWLLFAQPHNYSHLLQRECSDTGPDYVRQVEQFIEAHCDQPITSAQLAEVSEISMSSLYSAFRRYRGYTPLEFLKHIRLRRVRDALLSAPAGVTVKEVALKWGFSHLGRFSSEYRRRFGESPSETLARSQS